MKGKITMDEDRHRALRREPGNLLRELVRGGGPVGLMAQTEIIIRSALDFELTVRKLGHQLQAKSIRDGGEELLAEALRLMDAIDPAPKVPPIMSDGEEEEQSNLYRLSPGAIRVISQALEDCGQSDPLSVQVAAEFAAASNTLTPDAAGEAIDKLHEVPSADPLGSILPDIHRELERAQAKHGAVVSLEDQLMAIMEEVGETCQTALKHRHEGGDRSRIYAESVHVAVTALRLVDHLKADDLSQKETISAADEPAKPASKVEFDAESDYDYSVDMVWVDPFAGSAQPLPERIKANVIKEQREIAEQAASSGKTKSIHPQGGPGVRARAAALLGALRSLPGISRVEIGRDILRDNATYSAEKSKSQADFRERLRQDYIGRFFHSDVCWWVDQKGDCLTWAQVLGRDCSKRD